MTTLYPWQQSVWQQLLNNKQPHARLFTGIKGIGKTSLAYYFTAWLFCQQPQDKQPCGQCKSCQLLQSQQHPDLYLLKAEEKEAYGINNIRALRNNLLQSAQQSAAKVVLIEAAEKLTLSAANTLLKIVEEPPAKVYFIFITDSPALLPITLRSRCQNTHCPVPDTQQTMAWLIEQSQQAENIVSKALQLSGSSPLIALNLLQQPTLLAQYEQNANDFFAVLSGKQLPLKVAENWSNIEVGRLVEIIQYCLRKLVRNALNIGGQRKAFLQTIPLSHWFKLYDELLLGYQRLTITPGLNVQLFWEHFLLMAVAYKLS